MPQNTSSAVMQQRHEPDGSLDDFPTPPWAARALFEHVLMSRTGLRFTEAELRQHSGLEPACGRGHVLRVMREHLGFVTGSDVHNYGHGATNVVMSYLDPEHPSFTDWTITNPPFKLAEPFIDRALAHSSIGVAMLVRSAFLEGSGRHRRLFRDRPPTVVAQFVERVPMHRSRLLKKGKTATAYCWLVWVKNAEPRPFLWVPPCRKQLERFGDYFWSEDQ